MPNNTDFFVSGTYKTDITPPFGRGMAGFGNELAKISVGVSSRLFVTSNYICDPSGRHIVLVSCDLWSFPVGLGDYVIEKLHERKIKKYMLSKENVVFVATHTHHSPGNFSTAFGYNEGSGAVAGLDNKLFRFLGDRIAYSIQKAIDNSAPSNIAYAVTNLEGISRNRSLKPFLENDPEIIDHFINRINDASSLVRSVPACIAHDSVQYKAIDPTLTTILISGIADNLPKAVINNFGIHPTAMGSNHLLYSSDIIGVANGIVSTYLQSKHDMKYFPNISFINGAQGDVSADWITQGYDDTQRIGTSLATAIIKNLENVQTTLTTEIEVRVDYKEISNVRISSPIECDETIISRTALHPEIGESLLVGTEDGRVHGKNDFKDECNYYEGIPSSTSCSDAHGKKNKAFIGRLAKFTSPPKLAPVGIYQIGELHFITMPGEVSVGLAEELMRSFPGKSGHLFIAGLAQEYLSYFTTEAEYNLQHYEGGSTLFGVATAQFLKDEVSRVYKGYEDRRVYYGPKKYKRLGKINKQKLNRRNRHKQITVDTILKGLNLNGLIEGDEYILKKWSFNAKTLTKFPNNNLTPFLPKIGVYIKNQEKYNLYHRKITTSTGISVKIPQTDEFTNSICTFYVKNENSTDMSLVSIYIVPDEETSLKDLELRISIDN